MKLLRIIGRNSSKDILERGRRDWRGAVFTGVEKSSTALSLFIIIIIILKRKMFTPR